ncbi:latrophilin Cirl [Toxorhynchites rutilus septentrionalis]|uniref:latrophilin Cirl n=1 Tax=Toxorhynchites rutilus septentrionalis TaxID=329112 RepID=UPI002478A2E9|nr:latrophilin Cirl [Toxorhynchites rutilus septentrionalis]
MTRTQQIESYYSSSVFGSLLTTMASNSKTTGSTNYSSSSRSRNCSSSSSRSRRRKRFRAPAASCFHWSVWSSVALLLITLPTLNFAIAPKYETAYACEGKTLMIECENGDLINLIRANYGRFSITICNDHGNVDWSVNCMSPKSLRVLHSKCAQKQNCSVLASTNMFGDPCPGTHKYLEAHYQCVSAAQSSTTTNRPSPPWLKTSQPIVWSTSTVRNPVLSKLNFSDPLAGFGVTAAVSTSLATTAKMKPTTPYKQQTLMVNQQSPPSFRNKGFDNKSVNDDLAIIKTISDVASGKKQKNTDKVEGVPEDDEDFGNDEDYFPTQTAVLSNANRDRDSDGSKSYGESNVSVGGSTSSKRNDNHNTPNSSSSSSSSGSNNSGSNSNSNSVSGTSDSNANKNAVNNVLDVSHACGPTSARNLFWNVTRVGEANVQPCPGGATGIAKWRCVAIGSLTPEQRMHLQHEQQQQQQQSLLDDNNKSDISFNSNLSGRNGAGMGDSGAVATWYSYQPDLTQCRSLWLNNLEIRVNQQDSSLISIANDLSQVTSSKTLYGGDMLVATKIIQTMSQKMHFDIETIPDQRQREALVYELLNSVVKTGSNLLDQSQHASWLDLSVEDQMRVATSLLTGLEDNAFLLADTILRERHVVQKVKNILLSIRVLETRNFVKNEVFPDSSQERWQVSNDQIELPKAALIENSEGGLVRIVFVAFDRLEQILRPQFSNIQQTRVDQNKLEQDDSAVGSGRGEVSPAPRQRLLNSKVISASLGKGRHIQLSQPIRMILKHLRTKNVSNPTCVFWNYIDHAWSEDGCYVENTNATHTVCMCNHLTNFALLIDAIDETQLSLLSIIDDDLKILIYISVAIFIVIIVIALFSLKLFNGVFTKFRNGRGHHLAANNAADLHLPNHLQPHGLVGPGQHHLGADLDVNIHQHQQYNSAAGLMATDGHIIRGGHNHHNNNNLVTTTFNNLAPVGGGPGGPVGVGYETATHHRLAAQERINNNQINSRSKLLLLPYKPHHQHL